MSKRRAAKGRRSEKRLAVRSGRRGERQKLLRVRTAVERRLYAEIGG